MSILTEGTPESGSLTEQLHALCKLLLERNKRLRAEIYDREIDGEPVYKLLRKAITADRKHCQEWLKAEARAEAKDWDAELTAKAQVEGEQAVEQLEARIEAGANYKAISTDSIDPGLMSEAELLCLANYHAELHGGVAQDTRAGGTWGWAFKADPDHAWLYFASYQLSEEDPQEVWELKSYGSAIEEVIPASPGGEPSVNPDEHTEDSW